MDSWRNWRIDIRRKQWQLQQGLAQAVIVFMLTPERCRCALQDSPRDVQQLVVDCVETTSHVLRLWANRPCVLQGSSAAAKELTSVLLLYVGMTWQGPSISEARQQVASPGEQLKQKQRLATA